MKWFPMMFLCPWLLGVTCGDTSMLMHKQGHVYDAMGRGVPGVQMWLAVDHDPNIRLPVATTDANGFWEVWLPKDKATLNDLWRSMR